MLFKVIRRSLVKIEVNGQIREYERIENAQFGKNTPKKPLIPSCSSLLF